MLFYKNLNRIHNNVKFAYQLESNKQLPLLDVDVDISRGKLESSVYRKPRHTGLYNK